MNMRGSICTIFLFVCVATIAKLELERSPLLEDNPPSYVKKIMKYETVSYEKIEEIKRELESHKGEAVSFALENVYVSQNDIRLNRICLMILGALEDVVFERFEERFKSNKNLLMREKQALVHMLGYVQDEEHFRFLVDLFISDMDVVPQPIQKSRKVYTSRFCDISFNSALKKIEGTRRWSSHGKLFPFQDESLRDERIAVFRKWWNLNKLNLKWIEKKKLFVVEREEGDGIIEGSTKYNVIRVRKESEGKC